MIEIHAMQGEDSVHVATIHRERTAEDTDTPVHMISLARLERYWALEEAMREMVEPLERLVALLGPVDDRDAPG